MTENNPSTGSLTTAAATGSRMTALCALRDRLATDLDKCESARDVAALSRQLVDVLEQIAAARGENVAVRGEDGTGSALSDFQARLRQREARSARGA